MRSEPRAAGGSPTPKLSAPPFPGGFITQHDGEAVAVVMDSTCSPSPLPGSRGGGGNHLVVALATSALLISINSGVVGRDLEFVARPQPGR